MIEMESIEGGNYVEDNEEEMNDPDDNMDPENEPINLGLINPWVENVVSDDESIDEEDPNNGMEDHPQIYPRRLRTITMEEKMSVEEVGEREN